MNSIFKNTVMAFALMFTSLGAFAGVQVGVSSDNYFRGHNISDGVGYHVFGSHNLDNGLWGGVKLMSMDGDADHFVVSMVGYDYNLSDKIEIGVGYGDYSYQGGDLDGWNEYLVSVSYDGLGSFRYRKGLDDAGDMWSFSTGLLKYVDLSYGDWDDGGSYFQVSKSWDMLGGSVKVGYIDHEDNEDDFADKLTDFDNFFVGYSYNF
jgi:hypothetical protein